MGTYRPKRRRVDPTKKKTTQPHALTQRRSNPSSGRNPPVAENARVDTIGSALACCRVWGVGRPPYRSHSTPSPGRSPPARCTRAPSYDAIILRTRLFTKCLLFGFLGFFCRVLFFPSPARPLAHPPAPPTAAPPARLLLPPALFFRSFF